MKKSVKYIEELVERFLDGATTQAEERELYAFFSEEEPPAQLIVYKEMFAWFDDGLKRELDQIETLFLPAPAPDRKHLRSRIWGTIVAVAATIAVIFLIRPAAAPHESDPFEGSYIVRNGVKITDPALVRPELEQTLQQIEEQELRMALMLYNAYKQEIFYASGEIQRGRDMLNFIQRFPEGEAREEVYRILSDQE